MKKKLLQILSLVLTTQAIMAGSVLSTPSLVLAEENKMTVEAEAESLDEVCGYMPLEAENEAIPALKHDEFAEDGISLYSEDEVSALGVVGLPSYYVNSKLPEVREQGGYNTCWAIASLSLAEIGRGAVSTKSSIDLDYSEVQLAYFSYANQYDPLGGISNDYNLVTNGKSFMDCGGNMRFSQNTLAAWTGAADESAAKYSEAASYVSGKKQLEASDRYEKDELHLQNVRIAGIVNNRDEAKALIMKYGALAISYYDNSTYYNSSTYGYYCNVLKGNGGTTATQNHAAVVVGWDDDYSASNFKKTPEGDGAWRVRGSWGSGSRNGGYYWLSYYDKNLANASYAFGFEDATNYDNNYQYDGGCYSLQVKYNVSDYASMANIFVATSGALQEKIRAVGFETYTPNQKYKIEIYKNLPDRSSPVGGTLCEDVTVSGETTYRGFYTIELPKAVTVDAGEIYSVVVTFEATEGAVYIPFEIDTTGSWYQIEVSSATGQSFVKKGAANSWKDQFGKTAGTSVIYSLGNVRLKAYTDDVYEQNYTVEFSGGDKAGVTGEMPAVSFELNETRALPLNKFECPGYTFAGWKSSDGRTFEDGQMVSALAESGSSIKLTADWKATVYNIEYKNIDMEGVYDPGNPTTYSADISDITLKNPRRSGYTFLGWYESSDFDNATKISKISASSNGNFVLYAKWIRNISGVDDAPLLLVDMTNRPTFVISRSEGKKSLKINLEYGYDAADTSTWDALDMTVVSGMVDDEIYFYQTEGNIVAAIADGADASALPNGTYRFTVTPVTIRHLSELVLMNPVPVTVIVTD